MFHIVSREIIKAKKTQNAFHIVSPKMSKANLGGGITTKTNLEKVA